MIVFGNGGSLADSMHFAGEFNDTGISVISLSDPVKITAIANDFSFEQVFAIQLADIARTGDVVIGISSSGKSENVNIALELAYAMNLTFFDLNRVGTTTQEVQEYQHKLLHDIYLSVKKKLLELPTKNDL